MKDFLQEAATAPAEADAADDCVAVLQDPFLRGLALAQAGLWEKAAAAYEVAVAGAPGDALPWLNLAHARLKLADYARGADAASRAVALDPRCTVALGIAAQCLVRCDRQRDLIDLFTLVDMDAIDDAGLHVQLGGALTRLGRYEEAVRAFFGALRRDPRNAEAFSQLGAVFQFLKMPEEARESYRNAFVLGGSTVGLASAIVFTSFEASNWSTLDADIAALDALVAAGAGQPMPFYCLAFPWTRQQQLEAARAYAERLFQGIAPLAPPAQRSSTRPVRVGYVSSDFHAHATAYLIAEMLERHDRQAFEIFAYSYGDNDASPMRARIEKAMDGRFVEAREMSVPDLARRIRADGIDILVDLKGYTLYSRNDVFAYRAAPIQVNYLGFPGTLGSPHYDYVVGDPIVTPLAHADGYAEKIAQMPRCYQPNDRLRPIGAATSRERWGLPRDAFVFCSFNANYKITPQVFGRWCSLLRQIEDSVLWLFETNPQARKNLLAHAQRQCVDPARIYWAPGLALGEHLARIQVADLFLDTLPVNAHTTASDALWAGVPVLTVLGESFVSRVAASLVTAAGLPELVAADLDAYERIALELARDRQRLRALRDRLWSQRGVCALFDSLRYTRDFEALLLRMKERHDRGLAPDHLAAG